MRLGERALVEHPHASPPERRCDKPVVDGLAPREELAEPGHAGQPEIQMPGHRDRHTRFSEAPRSG